MANSPDSVWGIIWTVRDWMRCRWSISSAAGVMKRLKINNGVVIGLGIMEKIYFIYLDARVNPYDIRTL